MLAQLICYRYKSQIDKYIYAYKSQIDIKHILQIKFTYHKLCLHIQITYKSEIKYIRYTHPKLLYFMSTVPLSGKFEPTFFVSRSSVVQYV